MILTGQKYQEWVRERAKIIEGAISEGRIVINEDKNIVGKCEDCKEWRELSPDHRKKRSQGGTNDYRNIDWVCFKCHNKRDNMGDPNKKKIAKRKADWMSKHPCQFCKAIVSQLLCPNCGRLSVKP